MKTILYGIYLYFVGAPSNDIWYATFVRVPECGQALWENLAVTAML